MASSRTISSYRNRSRSRRASETLTAEFTSYQLVVGICVFLFTSLLCFMSGYVIARYDGAMNAAAAVASGPQAALPRNAPREVQAPIGRQPSATEMVIEEPAPVMPAAEEPPVTETPAVAADDAEQPIETETAMETETPAASDEPADEPAEEIEVAARIQRPDIVAPESPAQPEPPEAVAPPAQEPVAEAPVAEPEPLAVDASGWGVQIAAFTDSQRKQRAEETRLSAETNTGFPARVLQTNDGSIHAVVVTGFDDEQAARKMLKVFKEDAGYDGAFIRRLD